MVEKISAPFDLRKKVEITMSINNRPDLHGTITIIVPADDARFYRVGDVYAAHFKMVSER